MQARFDLAIDPAPVKLPPISIDLIWHERRHGDPLLTWARAQFVRAASQ